MNTPITDRHTLVADLCDTDIITEDVVAADICRQLETALRKVVEAGRTHGDFGRSRCPVCQAYDNAAATLERLEKGESR